MTDAPPLVALSLLASVITAWAGDLPPIVRAALKEAKSSCQPEAAKIDPGFVRRLDVNGDGTPDYVLSYEDVSCSDGGQRSCGSGGCLTQVFASSEGGYVKVLDETVQEVKFRRLRGRPAMVLGLHDSSCGKVGTEPCHATLYWNGYKFSPAN